MSEKEIWDMQTRNIKKHQEETIPDYVKNEPHMTKINEKLKAGPRERSDKECYDDCVNALTKNWDQGIGMGDDIERHVDPKFVKMVKHYCNAAHIVKYDNDKVKRDVLHDKLLPIVQY